MDVVVTQLFNGISLGSVLIMIGLGLSITFGLMNVINMSHGEMIMIGAYTTYLTQLLFTRMTPFGDTYLIFAILFSFAIAALFGLILEKTLIRFLYGRPLDSLLATWGVSLILQQMARSIFGAPNVAVIAPVWLEGGIRLSEDVILPYKRLFIIGMVIISLIGLYLLLYKSRVGLKIRAIMQNRDMAACLGIKARSIDSITFAIGSGIAGVAGAALTLLGPIGPTLGTNYIVDAFIVVVLGGVGKLKGVVFAGLGLGLINTFFEYFTTTTLAKVILFLLVIAFLQWKPSGLVVLRSRTSD